MDLLSRIASWLGENEATISAVVGITVLVGVVFAGLRSLVRRRAEPAQDKTASATPEPASTADSKPGDLDPLTVPGFEGRPAIAVLPFDNLSGDPEQEYFADGIAEDLITRLSAWRDFPVIARNSSFTYKGKPVDVKQVIRELGVRYLVEGSVRKAGERVRISAQLIDATTGAHIWAETYDRELRDIFELQDEITQAIVASMHPELERLEQKRAVHRDPSTLDAWDSILRGWWHLNQFTEEDNLAARRSFERAIEFDSHSSDGFAGVAFTHLAEIVQQWTESVAQSSAALTRSARISVELDSTNPLAQLSLSAACRVNGQQREMITAARRAVELNPSHSRAYAELAGALAMAGRSRQALEYTEQGMRLSPRDPLMWWFLQAASWAHFADGRYDEAVDWGRRLVQAYPRLAENWRILATACAHLGRFDEARSACDEMLRLQPGYSLENTRVALAAADPDFLGRYIDGLRKAGLPE